MTRQSGYLSPRRFFSTLRGKRGMIDCPCHDCGADTLPTADDGPLAETYMVSDEVWSAAGGPDEVTPERAAVSGGSGFFLCIGCLEARIGRRLVPDDFPDVPINDPSHVDDPRFAWSWRTARLRARLEGR